MPGRTLLSADELAELAEDYARGVSVAVLCRRFRVGRGRCHKIIAEQMMADAQDSHEAAEIMFGGSGGAAPPKAPPRVTAHFIAEEPPPPEATTSIAPVLFDSDSESSGDEKKDDKNDKSEKLVIAVEQLNEALAALATGSDDSDTIKQGLKALDVAFKEGGLGSGAAAKASLKKIKARLSKPRHEDGAGESLLCNDSPLEPAGSGGPGGANGTDSRSLLAPLGGGRTRRDNVAANADPAENRSAGKSVIATFFGGIGG